MDLDFTQVLYTYQHGFILKPDRYQLIVIVRTGAASALDAN
jgi:hypothetical protein